MWRGKQGKTLSSLKYVKNQNDLESLKSKLRNSKTRRVGEAKKLVLGNNQSKMKHLL